MEGFKMFFCYSVDRLLVNYAEFYVLAVFIASISAGAFSELVTSFEKHKFTTDTFVAAILVLMRIGIVAFLIFNWCTAAMIILGVFLCTGILFASSNDDLATIKWIWLYCSFIILILGVLFIHAFLTYEPIIVRAESHEIVSYNVKDYYDHESNKVGRLLLYTCKDENYSGKLKLEDIGDQEIYFCEDKNARIEIIERNQDLIDHGLFLWTVNLGHDDSAAKEETTFYLPNISFLNSLPAET